MYAGTTTTTNVTTNANTNTHIITNTRNHKCKRTHVRSLCFYCMHTHMHRHRHTRAHTHTHTHTRTRTHAHTHTHTHAHPHTHTHVYIHKLTLSDTSTTPLSPLFFTRGALFFSFSVTRTLPHTRYARVYTPPSTHTSMRGTFATGMRACGSEYVTGTMRFENESPSTTACVRVCVRACVCVSALHDTKRSRSQKRAIDARSSRCMVRGVACMI